MNPDIVITHDPLKKAMMIKISHSQPGQPASDDPVKVAMMKALAARKVDKHGIPFSHGTVVPAGGA